MTAILLRTLIDALPTPQPHDAIVRVQRWAGRSPAVTFTGDTVTLPDNVLVDLDRGSVEIPATDGRFCIRWTITPNVPGLKPIHRYTSIPIGAAVDFAALQDVDPTTFEPTDQTVSAWLAAIAEVTRLQDEIQDTAAQVDADADAAAASATAAQLSRTGAEVAHAAAAGYADDADNFAVVASQAAIHAAGSRDAAETAKSAAEAAQAGVAASAAAALQAAADADTDRQAAQTARADAAVARNGAETARNGAEAARDLALAGQFAGARLIATDLNTITTPGRYWAFATDVTTALNWPVAGATCIVDVYRIGVDTNSVIQEVRVHSGIATNAARGIFVRRKNQSWEAWAFRPSVLVDQSAGLLISVWDYLSSRWQRTHGDTGWRDISTLIGNGWTSTGLKVRRVGAQVFLRFRQLDNTGATAAQVCTLPTGFGANDWVGFSLPEAGSQPRLEMKSSVLTAWTDNLPSSRWSLPPAGRFAEISWSTSEPWPTALPGTALGTIPNT